MITSNYIAGLILSKSNPADILSRSVLGGQLLSHDMWLNCPSWLSYTLPELNELEYCHKDFEDEVAMNVPNVNVPLNPFPFERWGSYSKDLNCVAWVY